MMKCLRSRGSNAIRANDGCIKFVPCSIINWWLQSKRTVVQFAYGGLVSECPCHNLCQYPCARKRERCQRLIFPNSSNGACMKSSIGCDLKPLFSRRLMVHPPHHFQSCTSAKCRVLIAIKRCDHSCSSGTRIWDTRVNFPVAPVVL